MGSTILFALICCVLELVLCLPATNNPIYVGQVNQGTPDSGGAGNGEVSYTGSGSNNSAGSGSIGIQQVQCNAGELGNTLSFLKAAHTKLSTVYEPLKQIPTLVWNNSYIIADYNLMTKLNNEVLSQSKYNCSVLQQMIYTSILLVQCYSEQLGSVLTKLTYHAVHVSSEFNTFRDLIYKAYYNVTATKELGQLVEAFPSCYQWSKTVYNEDGGNITCSSQSSKVNSLPECSSSKLLCHNMTKDFLETMVLASAVGVGVNNLIKSHGLLLEYSTNCLSSVANSGRRKK